jgi:hypothetical protein
MTPMSSCCQTALDAVGAKIVGFALSVPLSIVYAWYVELRDGFVTGARDASTKEDKSCPLLILSLHSSLFYLRPYCNHISSISTKE